jgi:hypothetical protein
MFNLWRWMGQLGLALSLAFTLPGFTLAPAASLQTVRRHSGTHWYPYSAGGNRNAL